MEEGLPTQRGLFTFGRSSSAPKRRSHWFAKTSMFPLAVAAAGFALSYDTGVVNLFESLRRAVMP